jgi:hypothetical protein
LVSAIQLVALVKKNKKLETEKLKRGHRSWCSAVVELRYVMVVIMARLCF